MAISPPHAFLPFSNKPDQRRSEMPILLFPTAGRPCPMWVPVCSRSERSWRSGWLPNCWPESSLTFVSGTLPSAKAISHWCRWAMPASCPASRKMQTTETEGLIPHLECTVPGSDDLGEIAHAHLSNGVWFQDEQHLRGVFVNYWFRIAKDA